MGFGRMLAVLALLGGDATLAYADPEPPVPYRWQNVVVGGGGFAPGIVFSPVERGLAYLRTDMGGAYRWDAAAAQWVPLQDGERESSFMGIESITPDPVNADRVYMAAGMYFGEPAAIFRSDDRGAHWARTIVPFKMGGNEPGRGMGERLAVDPHAPGTLLFGSRHDGLWRSDDAGVSWRKVESFPLAGLGAPKSWRDPHGGLSFVLFDPAHAGRIFVASADPGQHHLYRSDDGGKAWQAVAGGPAPDMLPVKAAIGGDGVLTITYSDGIGPADITRGAVWRLDTRDGSWRDVSPWRATPGTPGGYMGVAVSASDPNVIAVSSVDRYNPGDTVWRSADGGRHWSELRLRSRRDVSATPFLNLDGEADFGHWIAGLAIDPFDPDHAAYITGATLYATTGFGRDGVMAWKPWTKGIEQTAILTLTSPTGGAPLVSGFGDIAGFRHDDLGVSPPHLHRNPYLVNTSTIDYAGTAPRVMVRSGSTHMPVVPDTSLAWSNDGGETWQPLRLPKIDRSHVPPPPELTGNAAITVSADGARFVVETETPLLTTDHGRHWSAVKGLPSRVRVTADKADARRFYAIDFAANRIVRSDDGGATFAPVASTGLPADLSAARATGRDAPNPLLAVPGRAGALWLLVGQDLYRSTDAGDHWATTGRGVTITRYGLGKGEDGSAWPALYAFATKDGLPGIFRSLDGGTHWQRINDDAHQWGLRVRVITGDPRRFGRVYIGTDGRGILYGDPAAASQ